MKTTSTQITKLLISDVPNLDPITVLLEDMGPGQGKLIVECYGRSWSAYWGGMGGPLVPFLLMANASYIAEKMFNGSIRVHDEEALEKQLKIEVLQRRRKQDLTHQEAYDFMYKIETSDFEHPFHLDNAMMVDLVGDDWHVSLPEKTNPDFAYLVRIIEAVKEGIRIQQRIDLHGTAE